jgi:hypothetical protein
MAPDCLSELALGGRDQPQGCREIFLRGNVYRPVLGLATRRMRAEKVAALPISVRTKATRLEAASAIRTDVVESLVSARFAKRAFERTNAGNQ